MNQNKAKIQILAKLKFDSISITNICLQTVVNLQIQKYTDN